jgi:hypothetical protein
MIQLRVLFQNLEQIEYRKLVNSGEYLHGR